MNLPSHAALARYGAVKVTTSSPGQVLVMLYEGLIRFLREAQTAMIAKDRVKSGERISRSHAILTELLGTLDASRNPALCAHLQSLYLFCLQHLLRANIGQNPEMIGDIIRILLPLRDAWVTAVASLQKPASP
jgi:flagellar protein FliS